jgi:Type II CAAX prenyl endopeptidase Rce1-like
MVVARKDNVILAVPPQLNKGRDNSSLSSMRINDNSRRGRQPFVSANSVPFPRDNPDLPQMKPNHPPTTIRRPRRGWRTSRRALAAETERWIAEHGAESYWAATQQPLASLLILAPAIVVYESAVLSLGGTATERYRSGADAWLRHGLASLGLGNNWFLPSLVLSILLSWHLIKRHNSQPSLRLLFAMLLESTGWAIALVGSSRLVDIGFSYLEQGHSMVMALKDAGSESSLAPLVGYLGAGIYEETLFRLALIPCLYATLRALQMPQVLSSSLAVTASSVLFAAAHHAGTPTETFTWFAFVFRWMAGVLFAWIFILRGFGIAVATHTIYDVLVGWVGWEI